jgi:hypothetical protein
LTPLSFFGHCSSAKERKRRQAAALQSSAAVLFCGAQELHLSNLSSLFGRPRDFLSGLDACLEEGRGAEIFAQDAREALAWGAAVGNAYGGCGT